MSTFSAQPRVGIEVYPFEEGGAKYNLTSSNGTLLDATISKAIHTSQPGTFTLTLAPGGPDGVNSVKTWTEIFTPMSLVIINGSRYDNDNLIMIGIVSNVTEQQEWDAATSAGRVITVTGYDFQYYFTQFTYYTLSMLGSTAASILQETLGSSALPALLSKGLLGGEPQTVGAAWFNDIMAGANGILSKTVVPYNNTQISFNDIMSQAYDAFPTTAGIIIPLNEDFLSVEGTWYDKFTRIFPMPWYEFFVITAQNDYYLAKGASLQSAKTEIPYNGKTYSPTLVARVLPIPQAVYNNGTWSMDTSRWEALPIFQMTGHSFISSTIEFSESMVRNFYLIQPTTLLTILGFDSSNISPFVLTFQGLIDVASIHRYGYRPQINTTYWFPDVFGQVAQNNAANQGIMQDFVKSLMTRISSWYEPTPLMASGEMTTIFRPDIVPGNRFAYAPFKNGEIWEFYIVGVTHNYRFGGETTTTLNLIRGLPQHIYRQTTPGLLTAIHIGEAMRQKGGYVKGLPQGIGSGLTDVNMQNAYSEIGKVAEVFLTPQAK